MSAIKLLAVTVANERETHALAARLARICHTGDVILLRGDLGTGKTSFARGFIGAIAPAAGEVTSPTFNLVQTYPAGATTIWHFDLWRLEHPDESREIGIDEAFETGITLIEWPEKIENQLPDRALSVEITDTGESSRSLVLRGNADSWAQRLGTIT